MRRFDAQIILFINVNRWNRNGRRYFVCLKSQSSYFLSYFFFLPSPLSLFLSLIFYCVYYFFFLMIIAFDNDRISFDIFFCYIDFFIIIIIWLRFSLVYLTTSKKSGIDFCILVLGTFD